MPKSPSPLIRAIAQELPSNHELFDAAVKLRNLGQETSEKIEAIGKAVNRKATSDENSPLQLLIETLGPNAISSIWMRVRDERDDDNALGLSVKPHRVHLEKER